MIIGAELIEVESVIAEENYALIIQFNNGQKKKVDLSQLLQYPPPVFEPLKDMKQFKKVSVNPVGGIQWESGADLSADYLLTA